MGKEEAGASCSCGVKLCAVTKRRQGLGSATHCENKTHLEEERTSSIEEHLPERIAFGIRYQPEWTL